MSTAFTLDTQRLVMRLITRADRAPLAAFLQDEAVMYAWEHAFSDEEVDAWIDEGLMRYGRDGYSYWAVIEKETGELVGVCGLLVEQAGDETHNGIGYIFRRDRWGRGYATEAARACMRYAFDTLGWLELTAQIRPGNTASRRVAERLGMTAQYEFNKTYRGKTIPHLLYRRTWEEYADDTTVE